MVGIETSNDEQNYFSRSQNRERVERKWNYRSIQSFSLSMRRIQRFYLCTPQPGKLVRGKETPMLLVIPFVFENLHEVPSRIDIFEIISLLGMLKIPVLSLKIYAFGCAKYIFKGKQNPARHHLAIITLFCSSEPRWANILFSFPQDALKLCI